MTGMSAATVLLVEDDAGDALMITEALRALNAPREIHLVVDGQEALDFLLGRGAYPDAPRPDLVLLDLRLPGMPGGHVLSVMKTDELLRMIPVVVLTASDDEQDLSASYDRHANAYVRKPADAAGFAEVVRAIDELFITVAMRPPHIATSTRSPSSSSSQ